MGFFYCQERGRVEDDGSRMGWKSPRSAGPVVLDTPAVGCRTNPLVAAHSGCLVYIVG